MASIIIPAHNEAGVIDRTLRALLASADGRDVEIVVVCNGCTDDTSARAARYAGVTVLETEIPSKVHALNLGDAHASRFPRLYLDADVVVSKTLLEDIEKALDTDRVLAAWPSVRYETTDAAPAVKAFYYVWTRLPYNSPGRIGVGLYALNAAARKRFEDFPDIISDDGFVFGSFCEDERIVVSSCHTVVAAPKSIRSLVKTRTRSRLGVFELRKKFPRVLQSHRGTDSRGALMRIGASPVVFCCLPVYVLVNVWVRSRAAVQLWRRDFGRWERDETTR